MHAERVGEDRLDHVAVADRDPDRVGAVLGLDRARPGGVRRRPRGLHRGHRLAAGERAPPTGCACTVFHSGSLASVLQRAALPVAVVALGAARARWRPSARAVLRRTIAGAVSRQRSSGLVTTRRERQPGQPLARRARPARRRCRRGGRPAAAGQDAGRVRGGAAVSDQDHVAMSREPSGGRSRSDAGRDRRQRALPQGRAGRRGLPPRTTWPRSATAATERRRLRLGRAARARPRTSSSDVAEVFGLHPLAVEDASTPTSGPSSSATTTRCSWSLKTLWYVDEDDAVETGEINMFVGRDFVVTVRHGEGAELHTARPRPRGSRPQVLAHGPSAVVYAVCDRVVDGYEEVGDVARGGRRRGRGVGVLRPSAPTTPRGSTSSSARSPRCAGR